MEFWEEARHEMTAEIREQVKADLERKYPYIQFCSYYLNASDGIHVIAINDKNLDETKEFLYFLGELEKKYAPDYDIFDIAIGYENFERLG